MVDTFFHSLTAFYKEHLWIKISAFVGLILGSCCVIAFSGGFPPWAWRFLAHVLTQLPSLWAAQGTALLPALLGLLLISLSLLIVWVVLVFLLIKAGRGIWLDMSAQRHFERDLAEAEFLAQEQAEWTREQDEHDSLTQPEYLPELRRHRPSAARATPTNAGRQQRQQQERIYADRDHGIDATRETGASTSRVRRTVPLIPPSRPTQQPAAQQQFRPVGSSQNAHAHTLVSFTQTSAPHRLHMVPNFSAAATVEDNLLPQSFHHQQRGASTLDRQAAYHAQEDEEVSSVWGERQQHYAEQDTRPAQDWWDEADDEQEELVEQDEDEIPTRQEDEEWDEYAGTQPLDDEEDEENIDEGDEEEIGWSQEEDEEIRQGYNTMQPEEDWNEEDEDIIEIPTHQGATSRAQRPLTRTMLEEEMAAPLSEESADAKIQEQAATMDIPRDIRLVIGIGLDPGLSRKQSPNEDSVFAIEGMRVTDRGPQPAGLFIVADGMGGHTNGREASHSAVNSMSDAIIPSLLRETCDRSQAEEEALFLDMLKQGVHQANLALYQKNREAHSSMGTTLTAALIVNLTAYVVNVGDSRTYLYRPTEGLTQVTRDHSVVARMVEVGAITKDEVYTHPKRNQIYRCLGEHATVDIDTFSVPVNVGDILLLCSDGLWEMVRDQQLEHIIDESTNPSQISSKLVQAALQGGGADNIGAIVVAMADASE